MYKVIVDRTRRDCEGAALHSSSAKLPQKFRRRLKDAALVYGDRSEMAIDVVADGKTGDPVLDHLRPGEGPRARKRLHKRGNALRAARQKAADQKSPEDVCALCNPVSAAFMDCANRRDLLRMRVLMPSSLQSRRISLS